MPLVPLAAGGGDCGVDGRAGAGTDGAVAGAAVAPLVAGAGCGAIGIGFRGGGV